MTSPITATDRGRVTRISWRVVWVLIGVIGGATLILGTLGSPGGLGINGAQTIRVERDRNWRIIKYSIDRSDGRTAWDWLGLIGVPATLAVLGIWFQSQEQKRASLEAEEQRKLAAEENKEETLQRYFDRVAQLLIEKDLIALSKVSNSTVCQSASDVIRARTLSVLRGFSDDGERKGSVIRFLSETEVLARLKVSLSGAELGSAHLSWTNLSKSNLSEADLTDADLRSCRLDGVDLHLANLSCADLSLSSMVGANLRFANLCGADLSMVNLSGANLYGVNWDNSTKWPPHSRVLLAEFIPESIIEKLVLVEKG